MAAAPILLPDAGVPLVLQGRMHPDWYRILQLFASAYNLKATADSASQTSTAASIASLTTRVTTLEASVVTLSQLPRTAYTTYASNADIATPYQVADDTIPQITEGTEVLSTSITPIRSTSRIRCVAVLWGATTGVSSWIASMFKDGAADAVQAIQVTVAASTAPLPAVVVYEFAPGATAAVTISVRAGPISAGTLRLNGTTAARLFGGAAAATLHLQELFQ